MARLVREAIEAGAAGFSTSFSFAHRGVDGKPVPSRFAEARRGRGAVPRGGRGRARAWCSSRPGEQCTYADVYEWQPRIGRPFTYPLFAAPGGKHLEPVAAARAGSGARRAGLAAGHAAAAHDAVHAGRPVQPQHRHGVRRADEGEPRRRASPRTATRRGGPRAAADLEDSPMKPRWETFEVSESERFPELQGRRVSELAGERGCSPLDVMCELVGRRGPRRRASARTSPTTTSTRSRTCSPTTTSRSVSPTRARTSTSCATRRCPPTCSARGCASAGSCRSSTRCAS